MGTLDLKKVETECSRGKTLIQHFSHQPPQERMGGLKCSQLPINSGIFITPKGRMTIIYLATSIMPGVFHISRNYCNPSRKLFLDPFYSCGDYYFTDKLV